MNDGELRAVTAPEDDELGPVLRTNIDALIERRRASEKQAGIQERAASSISRFVGSMPFVYIHIVFYGIWIVVNTGWIPVLPAWDPSLVILAMEASVEAIFLSTFVLINQNRMAAQDNLRADLDLQVNLLNERETTRLIYMVEAIAAKLNVSDGEEDGVSELKKEVRPEAILDHIERKGEA
ncbi:DUF1003 domain-containing protein [Agrobacterium sp. CG674]